MKVPNPSATMRERKRGKFPKPHTDLAGTEKPVNKGRHEFQCTVCAHPDRKEIEQEFVDWVGTIRIASTHSISRDSIYRHAHALGLMQKRRQNVRAALERIIEGAGEVEVNAAAVVSAVSAYARINSRGEWIERTETVNLNALFDRMSEDELSRYAREGVLPGWFEATIGATGYDSPEGANDS
jgi:hypothetical protein